METNKITNQECADILKRLLASLIFEAGRGNNKSKSAMQTIEAFTRAIELLEAAPEKVDD